MSGTNRPSRSHVGRLLGLAGIAVAIGVAVSILLTVASYVVLIVLGSALEGPARGGADGVLVAVYLVVGAVVVHVAGRVAGLATVRLGDPPWSRPAVIVPLALFAFLGGWGSLGMGVGPAWLSLVISVVALAVVVHAVRVSRRRALG